MYPKYIHHNNQNHLLAVSELDILNLNLFYTKFDLSFALPSSADFYAARWMLPVRFSLGKEFSRNKGNGSVDKGTCHQV